MLKKLICSLLAVLMILLTLCACDDQNNTSENGEDSEAPKQALVPHLGEADYSGKTLRILSMTSDGLNYNDCMFATDETTGEPINDACFERLQSLKQAYGFDVKVEFIEAFTTLLDRVKMDSQSGLVEYDCVYTGVTTLCSAAAEGTLKDINTIENSHLQLDKEWWDGFAAEGLTLDGRLFCITGDIAVTDDEYTYCMFYNKDLIEENHLDNPSTLALEGKWTVDQMYTMMKAVAQDDGDGKMDVFGKDVWGLMGHAFMLHTIISGCNAPITSRDANGKPVLAMLDDRNVRAFDKCFDIIKDETCAMYAEQFFRWDDTDNMKTFFDPTFYSGRALFYPTTIQTVNTYEMRNSSIRYGILPLPKLDEEQEYYANMIDPYWFGCIAIVRECEDTDFVTFALEALAYTGRKLVTPEYYDRTLKNKRFLDDNDSPEVLDIIFSQRLIDQSIIYNWGDCIQYYNSLLWNDQGLASFADSKKDTFEVALEETLEKFKKMN